MLRKIPDWLIYGAILLFFYMSARNTDPYPLETPPPPELGPALPNASPSDPRILIQVEQPKSGVGTAFAADDDGSWLTARHVVDGCDKVALRVSGKQYVQLKARQISRNSDTALMTSNWKRPALPQDLDSNRRIGEYGFFVGFPQGRPGESIGALLGRRRMVVRGRYSSNEQILAWSEVGRSRGLKGSLGGLSGGPAFDADGEVIGLVTAENSRRGRVYTVAPATLQTIMPAADSRQDPQSIDLKDFARRADTFRRTRQIAQVYCLVE